jgi:hypothetical protein
MNVLVDTEWMDTMHHCSVRNVIHTCKMEILWAVRQFESSNPSSSSDAFYAFEYVCDHFSCRCCCCCCCLFVCLFVLCFLASFPFLVSIRFVCFILFVLYLLFSFIRLFRFVCFLWFCLLFLLACCVLMLLRNCGK